MNYAEFLLTPEGITQTVKSFWECRNLGLLKIMTRIFEMLQDSGDLNERYTIRINTADSPTKDAPTLGAPNFIEFNTTSFGPDEHLFPDFVFGNWWHIGLVSFDSFVEQILERSDSSNVTDVRLFWAGSLQGVEQRLKYVDLLEEHPDKLAGGSMTWSPDGRIPSRFVHLRDFCRYGHLLDLSGLGFSARLKLLPFCNRPLFVAERSVFAWSDLLILGQGLHVPVAGDLSDLISRYEWARRNTSHLQESSEKLLEFSRENLSFDKACWRGFDLVSRHIFKKNLHNTKKFDVVVDHDSEDLSWLRGLKADKIHVYTSSNLKIWDSKLVVHPRGVAHPYLDYCRNESPADFVFFLKGNPSISVSSWIQEVESLGLPFTYNFVRREFLDSCFGVSGELARSVSESWFEESSEVLERMWFHVFNMGSLPILKHPYMNFFGGDEYHGVMKLNDDGTIGLYEHFNESYWELISGNIVIYDGNRKPSSFLFRKDGGFEGYFIHDSSVTHRLIPVE